MDSASDLVTSRKRLIRELEERSNFLYVRIPREASVFDESGVRSSSIEMSSLFF